MIPQNNFIHRDLLCGHPKVAVTRTDRTALWSRLRHETATVVAALLLAAVGAACSRDAFTDSKSGAQNQAVAATNPPAGLEKLQHIVVIYLENHSFDNL